MVIFLALVSPALAADPAFDVASVKISKTGVRREVIQAAPGSLTMRNVLLRTCVDWAYGVDEYQIKGPTGSLPNATRLSPSQVAPLPPKNLIKLMLQALLADRFQLKFHRDSKITQVYVLTVAKDGPKFRSPAKTANLL
jgi:uncharacterized protein (TIGR03435 family)